MSKVNEGKVIDIPVKEVTKGMQVILINKSTGNMLIRRVVAMLTDTKVRLEFQGILSEVKLSELKELVIEYEEEPTKEQIQQIRSTYDCAFYGYNWQAKVDKLRKSKQLPLKYSQWQAAIDNGEVRSNKKVKFEIMDYGNKQYGHPIYAKIIPQKERKYTREYIEELLHEFNSTLIEGKVYDGYDLDKWIEEKLN